MAASPNSEGLAGGRWHWLAQVAMAAGLAAIVVGTTGVRQSLAWDQPWRQGVLAWGSEVMANWRTPHAGEEVLPGEVRDMLWLVRRHDVGRYRVSANLSLAHWQRIQEGLWPRRFDPGARHGLMLAGEVEADSGYRVIETRGVIALVYLD